jgi:hypothetical protein
MSMCSPYFHMNNATKSTPIYSLGGADGNRTHVLKVTELLTLRAPEGA